MKIDDLIKDFEEKSKSAISENRNLWEGEKEDNLYNVDIHIWRKTGMGNSLQTIVGNKLSIMTATASYLETLLRKKVISKDELKYMIKNVIKGYEGKL